MPIARDNRLQRVRPTWDGRRWSTRSCGAWIGRARRWQRERAWDRRPGSRPPPRRILAATGSRSVRVRQYTRLPPHTPPRMQADAHLSFHTSAVLLLDHRPARPPSPPLGPASRRPGSRPSDDPPLPRAPPPTPRSLGEPNFRTRRARFPFSVRVAARRSWRPRLRFCAARSVGQFTRRRSVHCFEKAEEPDVGVEVRQVSGLGGGLVGERAGGGGGAGDVVALTPGST